MRLPKYHLYIKYFYDMMLWSINNTIQHNDITMVAFGMAKRSSEVPEDSLGYSNPVWVFWSVTLYVQLLVLVAAFVYAINVGGGASKGVQLTSADLIVSIVTCIQWHIDGSVIYQVTVIRTD